MNRNVVLIFVISFISLMNFQNLYSQNKEEILLLKKYEATILDIQKFVDENNSSEEISVKYIKSKANKFKDAYFKNTIQLLIAGKLINTNNLEVEKILKETKQYVLSNNEYEHLQIHYQTITAALYSQKNDSKKIISISKKNIALLQKYKKIDQYWDLEFWNTTLYINALLDINKEKEALNELIKIENNYTKEQNIELYCFALSQLGFYHYNINNYDEAIKKYKLVIKTLTHNKNKYNNILLSAYNNIGVIYSKKKDNNATIFYLKEGLKIATKENIIDQKANISKSLAGFYFLKKEYDFAEKYALDALNISKKARFIEFEAVSNAILSKVYLKNKKFKKGITHIDEALQYYKNTENESDLKSYKNALITKNSLLKEMGNYKEANEINSLLVKILDSLNQSDNTENLQKTLIAYETEKKDKAIVILKQKEEINAIKIERQKQQILFLVAGLFIIVVFSTTLVIFQKKLNTIQNLSLRSKLTRSQFNPHYINNAFTALQAELVAQNYNENIVNYTSNISRFSRLMLESTFNEEWSLNQEIQIIDNYLKTQQFRLENNFQYELVSNLSKEQMLQLKIPSVITQIALENAIEHGNYSKQNIGHIHISIEQKNKTLRITIKNNIFENFNLTTKKLHTETSRGLEITKQRLTLHSKIHKKNSNFNFIKLKKEAIATFELPILNI